MRNEIKALSGAAEMSRDVRSAEVIRLRPWAAQIDARAALIAYLARQLGEEMGKRAAWARSREGMKTDHGGFVQAIGELERQMSAALRLLEKLRARHER